MGWFWGLEGGGHDREEIKIFSKSPDVESNTATGRFSSFRNLPKNSKLWVNNELYNIGPCTAAHVFSLKVFFL